MSGTGSAARAGASRARVVGLDLVTPDLFEAPGGIARIARAMTLAAARWAGARGVTLTAHALMDFGGKRRVAYLPEPHAYRPWDGARAALARALAVEAWRAAARGRTRAVVFLHPNLAVLGLALPPSVRAAALAHGIDVWAPLRPERRLALRRMHALWAVSEDTAAKMIAAQGVAPARVRVVANALDPCWPMPDVVDARAGRTLLAVSRLEPDQRYKGLDDVLGALAALPPEARAPLVVAGDGADRARLEARARALGIDATFVGHVGDAALAALYRDARAFVLPSRGEGFGLVYLEAMAFGLPCVGARAGGVPEVIADGVSGVLVPPGDVPALAAAIVRALGPEGASLGAAGRARVEGELGYAAYEARVHAALDALVA